MPGVSTSSPPSGRRISSDAVVVAAALVVTHVGGALALGADQGVDQRRLAHPRGTEQDDRAVRGGVGAELIETGAGTGGNCVHRNAEGDLGDPVARRVDVAG
jgi:hypothetical protein